jgi:LysR family transcriptional regulator of gallate degradation
MITKSATSYLDINLRQLFVFMTVAHKGSASGAASTLLRASSTVVRTISSLERLFGVRLLDRRARGMVVNAFGQAVLVRAERISAELRELSNSIRPRKSIDNSRILPPLLTNARRLAIIDSLSEKGNMASVAKEFRITQAAVSTSLKDLEGRIGMRLFDRSKRGLVATEAGAAVVFRFRRCLAELRHIDSDVAALGGTVQGTVKIGALPLGRTRILPRCIATVLAQYPLLSIETFESPYELLAAQLRSGDIDFIFGALRPPHEAVELSQYTLFDDYVSVIGRAGHPLAIKKGLSLRDLRTAKWVLWRSESPSRKSLGRYFSDSGFAPLRPSVETGDLAILRGLLLQSDMLAAISSDQLRYELDRGDLIVLPIDLERTRRGIGVTLRQGALPSAAARVLLDEIRATVDRMIKDRELLPARGRSTLDR